MHSKILRFIERKKEMFARIDARTVADVTFVSGMSSFIRHDTIFLYYLLPIWSVSERKYRVCQLFLVPTGSMKNTDFSPQNGQRLNRKYLFQEYNYIRNCLHVLIIYKLNGILGSI